MTDSDTLDYYLEDEDLSGYRMFICPDCVFPHWQSWRHFFGGRGRSKRKLSDVGKKTSEEWVVYAEQLSLENNGFLPGYAKLRSMGLHGLITLMEKSPRLFSHLTQELGQAKKKTLDEWVTAAENVAAENGGLLPPCSIMRKTHPSLLAKLQRNQQAFAHIPMARLRPIQKDVEEWVEYANDLAIDGTLPCTQIIVKRHPGLYGAMQRYPEKFEHLIVSRKKLSRESRIFIAEQLALLNGGVPHNNWLRKNGYSGTARLITNEPKLFAHLNMVIPQPGLTHSLEYLDLPFAVKRGLGI